MCYMRSRSLVLVGEMLWDAIRGLEEKRRQRGCRRKKEPGESELAPALALAVPCSSELCMVAGGRCYHSAS